jgi:hypothetical protein
MSPPSAGSLADGGAVLQQWGVLNLRSAVVALMLLALPIAFACAENSDDTPSAGSGLPGDVFAAIDDEVRNNGLEGATAGSVLVAVCDDAGVFPALCIDLDTSTVLADEATVRVYANLSDASWDVSLLRRDDGWLVTNVAYTGP